MEGLGLVHVCSICTLDPKQLHVGDMTFLKLSRKQSKSGEKTTNSKTFAQLV